MVKEIKLGKGRLLSLLYGSPDGITPEELAEEFGLVPLSAAAILSRYKKQGIILRKRAEKGCRYCLSEKGERKLRYLESRTLNG